MRTILGLFTLLIIFQTTCFSATDTTNYPIEIFIKIDKEYFVNVEKSYYDRVFPKTQYNIKGDSAKEKRYDINLTIKNNSSRTIYIWLMTCSWTDCFMVNNDYIFIGGQECLRNFPEIVEFKPGQSKEYKTTLIKSIKFDYPPKYTIYGPQVETTKLGLITINDIFKKNEKEINMLTFDTLMKDKSKWTITWSNPLYLLSEQQKSK
jgi:hypothetical protein